MDYRKPNSKARINRLTPEQRERVFLHCDTVTIKDGVLWLKSEFNLDTSLSALSSWLRKERARKSMADRMESLLLSQEKAAIMGKVRGGATGMTVANSVLIAKAVFDEMQKAPSERDQKKLTELMRLCLIAKDQELREKKFSLEQKRFLSNSSKADAANRKPSEEPEMSPEEERERVERAMLRVFGPEPPAYYVPPEKEGR